MIVSLMLAVAAVAATENVPIEHAGRALAARYRAEIAVTHRQVGAIAGTRMGTRRCDWKAKVVVHRELAGRDDTPIPALSRALAGGDTFSGSRMGECDAARRAIDAEVAARDDAVRAQLAQAIADDRPRLMAELDSIGPVMAARAR